MSARATQHAPDNRTTPGDRPTRRGVDTAAHSLRIGKLFGIPLQVHWSFLLLVALVVVAEWPAGAGGIVGGLIWVAALFASVVVHELAHCLVARRRGGTVLGILLLPIGGMSRMGELPTSPADEAAIAAVGPATSLLLGGLLLAVGALAGSAIWPPTLVAGSWLARLGWLNLLLGVFNLLPALPMDGGRVLRAGLARRLPRLAATRVAASVARVLAIGLIVAGVFYDFWLVFIGVFVFMGASREVSIARAEELAKRGPPSAWIWWGGGGTPPPGWNGWAPPGSSTPQAPPWASPGDPRDHWPPPFGQQPGPRERLPIDVPVEGAGPQAGRGEPLGEGVGEDD
jgi:Zn-dependent protease